MRHGKKPTRKQKIRLGRVGLSPENWLIVREKPSGELVILHKHTDRIRVIPSGVKESSHKPKRPPGRHRGEPSPGLKMAGHEERKAQEHEKGQEDQRVSGGPVQRAGEAGIPSAGQLRRH